ncbi:MAG: acyl-CoA dehydrogenase family protein, partial [Thermomicrobiaceae bacterium]|nr:acyl-CoA dehydrogenase family protein [Thermomicrobiaceae bacterium]
MAEATGLAERGGGWLIEAPAQIFTPEACDDTVRMLRESARSFVEREVLPVYDRMEHGELDLNVPLMEKAGELGLLGVEVPEAYGGLDLPKVAAIAIWEELARVGGFAVTYGAHVTLGTLPLVYFGTEAQKQRY